MEYTIWYILIKFRQKLLRRTEFFDGSDPNVCKSFHLLYILLYKGDVLPNVKYLNS